MKKCTHCLVNKNKNEFYFHATNSDKLTSWCRKCQRAEAKKTYVKHKLFKTSIAYSKMTDFKCAKCGIKRPSNQFYKNEDKNTKDTICMNCRNFEKGFMTHGVGTRRPCLGVSCRGVKFFTSYGGARICPACKALIRGSEDFCSWPTITRRTSKTR